jgi:anti-sigma factor RsiW
LGERFGPLLANILVEEVMQRDSEWIPDDWSWVRGAGSPCLTAMEVASYVDGFATPEECRRVEEHIVVCQECRAAIEDIAAVVAEPLDEYSAPPSPELIAFVLNAVAEEQARLKSQADASRPRHADDAAKHQPKPTRRLSWLAAAACLLFAVIPALAYVGSHLTASWRDVDNQAFTDETPADTSLDADIASADDRSADAANSVERVTTEGRELSELLDQEMTTAAEQALLQTLLPQTEEEYEAWARKEYPHIMWLYDVLRSPKNNFHWDGSWQELVVESGEVFRFDTPRSPQDSNCLPRLDAIVRAAAVAEFETIFTIDKQQIPLPRLQWARESDTVPIPSGIVMVKRLGLRTPIPILSAAVPEEYVDHLSCNPAVTQQALVYMAVAYRVVESVMHSEVSVGIKLQWEHMIENIDATLREVIVLPDGSTCAAIRTIVISDLFDQRRGLLISMESEGIKIFSTSHTLQ